MQQELRCRGECRKVLIFLRALNPRTEPFGQSLGFLADLSHHDFGELDLEARFGDLCRQPDLACHLGHVARRGCQDGQPEVGLRILRIEPKGSFVGLACEKRIALGRECLSQIELEAQGPRSVFCGAEQLRELLELASLE